MLYSFPFFLAISYHLPSQTLRHCTMTPKAFVLPQWPLRERSCVSWDRGGTAYTSGFQTLNKAWERLLARYAAMGLGWAQHSGEDSNYLWSKNNSLHLCVPSYFGGGAFGCWWLGIGNCSLCLSDRVPGRNAYSVLLNFHRRTCFPPGILPLSKSWSSRCPKAWWC